MILAIDCGNSRLKWGVHDGAQWRARGLVEYADLPALGALVASLGEVERVVVANVAGEAVREAVGRAVGDLARPVHWVVACRQQCGVVNHYDDPGRLGADRWAALIGARRLHEKACLVVCAGTATTVDVLGADGHFQGGVILPGLALMLGALARNTAQLPLAQGRFMALPRSTDDAILSGCLHAQAGAIERMFAPIAAEDGACCLLSGGAAQAIEARLAMPRMRVDNLVLEGLARIGQEPGCGLAGLPG